MTTQPSNSPTKLRKLVVNRVDLVDFGANYDMGTGQGAHITLVKRAVPPVQGDPSTPVTKQGGFMAGLRSMFESVGKNLGWTPADVEKVYEAAETFNEALEDKQRSQRIWEATSDLWEFIDALRCAVDATLRDDDPELTPDRRRTLIETSLEQFTQAIQGKVDSWVSQAEVTDDVAKVGRKLSGQRLERLRALHEQLGNLIHEVDVSPSTTDDEGGQDVSKINKNGLSPEVLKYIEELESKLAKAADDEEEDEDEEMYKSLPPKLREKLEKQAKDASEARAEVAKMREESELREYLGKAQGLPAIPGVTAEALGPALRTLAKAAPDAFNVVYGALEAANSLIEKGISGPITFVADTQVAKTESAAYNELLAKATDLRKGDSKLTMEQAIAKAGELYPEIRKRYQDEVRAAASGR